VRQVFVRRKIKRDFFDSAACRKKNISDYSSISYGVNFS
jgi:hypothetical protein